MSSAAAPRWRELCNRRMVICLFTGFASGLPLYILITLIPAWLRSEGVGLAEIGFFALIGLPYTWKFIWAPLVDRFALPVYRLGLRRSWMLATQLLLLAAIGGLGWLDPNSQLGLIATLSFAVALLSASQDVVLDAYRRELLPDHELGLGNSLHVNAYRVAGLVPGSLSLILADLLPWSSVFVITASFMLVAIGMTAAIAEPTLSQQRPATLRAAVVEPFNEFFARNGRRQALAVLTFMLLYKLGDSLATALATPFYLDMGFTTTDIGLVAKHAALWPMIIGGILGGLWMVKIGINRALWLFGVVQVVSILGFALLAHVGGGLWLLALVIGFEYLGVGLGTAAFVAFIARTTHPAYAATQIALFTAITALPRTVANAATGVVVEAVGWELFFYGCALLALPGMLLLVWVAPWHQPAEPSSAR